MANRQGYHSKSNAGATVNVRCIEEGSTNFQGFLRKKKLLRRQFSRKNSYILINLKLWSVIKLSRGTREESVEGKITTPTLTSTKIKVPRVVNII